MAKFRKKPILIEAVQWFPGTPVEGVERVDALTLGPGADPAQLGWCPTLEGGYLVSPGDWIITGAHGKRYPCKPDIFAQMYEPAGEP
jgi:hypothetical protein